MANIKVMIDPGRSPYDQNGGSSGYLEHKGMWLLSNYLAEELQELGINTKLTRQQKEVVSLWERGRRAAEWEADFFISQHSNASGNGKKRSVESYYSVARPTDLSLANVITAATSKVMNNTDLGGKTKTAICNNKADFHTVIQSAQIGGVPHIILMVNGFHDNFEDEAFLSEDENLHQIAKAQANAIAIYFGVN